MSFLKTRFHSLKPVALSWSCALLALCMLSGPTAAQQGDDEDARMPGLEIDPEVLRRGEEAEEKEQEPETPESIAAAADAIARRVNIEILSRYPGSAAQTLIDELVARGEGSLPFLHECLDDPDLRVRLASASALGQIRAPESFDAVRIAASAKDNLPRLPAFADALIRIDRAQGLKVVSSYLESTRSVIRRHARDTLMTHIKPGDIEKTIAPLLASRRGEARQFAIEIIAQTSATEYMSELFACLRDEHPGAAFGAARVIAANAGDPEWKQLNQLVVDFDARQGAYALLALVMGEDAAGDRLISEDAGDRALEALSSSDLLDRGVAAISMANLSAWMEDPSFKNLLDRGTVPLLIDTAGSKTYYKDHQVLREIVLRKLATLTGKNFTFDWQAWREWWRDVRNSFTAQRGVRSASSITPETATLRWLSTGQRGGVIDVLIATSGRTEYPGEAIRISRTDMRTLIDGIAYEGFFDLPETIGAEDSGSGRITIVLQGDGRARSVSMIGAPMGPKAAIFSKVISLLADVRYRNQWQRYHDVIAQPDHSAWWAGNYKWWSSRPDGDQAARRLRTMVISTLDQLPTLKRQQAFQDIAVADQLAGEPISIEEARFLVGPMGDGDLSQPEMHLLVSMIAAAHPRGMLPQAINAVATSNARNSQELMTMLFAGYDRASVEPFLGYPDEVVRAAAAQATGEFKSEAEAARKALAERLDDRSPMVQSAAAYGLGNLGDPAAIEILQPRLADAGRFVRKSILSAIGKLGGPRAVEAVMPYVNDPDRLARQAALVALGQSGDANAVYPLMSALQSETSPIGRRIAQEALATFPGPEALDALLSRYEQADGVIERVSIIETLSLVPTSISMADERTRDLLRRVARDEENEVREAGILSLARLGDLQAVPGLIALVDTGENPRAIAALRGITYQDFGPGTAAAIASRYREWWGENGSKSWQWWLVDAMARHGYSPVGLFEAISGGEDAMRAVPTLIDALTDNRRELRSGAARLLSEITGQDFGSPDRAGDDLGLAILAARWRSWYEATGRRR